MGEKRCGSLDSTASSSSDVTDPESAVGACWQWVWAAAAYWLPMWI